MILGKHTLNETRDLLAVVDYRFKTVQDVLKDTPNKPQDLVDDWNALFPKWVAARDSVVSELRKIAAATIGASPNVVATETQWQRVLSFFQGQELVKGSFQDITNRLSKISSDPRLKFSNDPKQGSPDVDLAVFKELDSDIKAGEAAAEAAKEKAKEAATSNIGLIVGGSMLAGAAGIIALKYYLR